jgi:O-antigen/teichoic acid export membrane protein
MMKGTFSGNSLQNFLAQVFIMGVAVVSVPFLVTGLGPELFGLLSLLWMFVGYFTIFDLGIGQAAVKFLAESVGRGDRHESIRLVRASSMLSGGVGLVSGLVVLVASLAGFERLLSVPDSLRDVAQLSLQVLAAGVPAALLQATLRGVPLAFNRFGIVNGLRVAAGVLQWGGSVVVLALGGGFLGVILLTVVTRYAILLVYCVVVVRLLPGVVRERGIGLRGIFPRIVTFGGWVSVGQVIPPLMTFLERVFVANMIALAWVTYYTVPNDVMIRFLVVPISLVHTLVPFMSSRWISDDGRGQAKLLYLRSMKVVLVLMLPIAAMIALFSHDILDLWMGAEFASYSSVLLAVLAAGLVWNTLAQLPTGALQALGRPDVPAKLMLVQLPLYAGLSAAGTALWGIVGTGAVWVVRVTVESIVLIVWTNVLLRRVRVEHDASYIWKTVGLVAAGTLSLLLMKVFDASLGLLAASGGAVAVLYGLAIWHIVLDDHERNLVRSFIPLPSRERGTLDEQRL